MQTIGLAELLAPVTSEQFFKTYWPHSPLFIPATAPKLPALFDLPQLRDVEALMGARVLKVRACLPDYDDEYSSIMLEPEEALKVYRNNMTLVLDFMQTQSEVIADLLKRVRVELGLPSEGPGGDLTHARSIAYASPAGGRTRLHFDANANFVIQLRGTKRWSLAPNTSVENPTERYTSCSGEIAERLEYQCHAELLERLPPDSSEYLMEPGCILFVPRGYWHETTTEEDSLSVNLTYSQPTWADVIAKSFYEHLLLSPEWRQLADGLESLDPKRKEAALARLESERARAIKSFSETE